MDLLFRIILIKTEFFSACRVFLKPRTALRISQLEDANRKLEHASSEQEALIDIFSEERTRRDKEEENLRKKLKVEKHRSLLSFFFPKQVLKLYY